MARILVTNDDGVHAPGLMALYMAMNKLGDACIVAPDRERSAAGHSLTLHRPLKAEEIRENVFSVNGTLTDCVTLGINKLLTGKPDLVVTGINKGANLGDDITYSGTVSAAIEGTIFGIPSIAYSLISDKYYHYDTATFGRKDEWRRARRQYDRAGSPAAGRRNLPALQKAGARHTIITQIS